MIGQFILVLILVVLNCYFFENSCSFCKEVMKFVRSLFELAESEIEKDPEVSKEIPLEKIEPKVEPIMQQAEEKIVVKKVKEEDKKKAVVKKVKEEDKKKAFKKASVKKSSKKNKNKGEK
jgi:hypothetical protein